MDPNNVKGQLAQSFTVTYGSGGIRGNVASDHFSLNTLMLPALLFGEVTSEDSTIAGYTCIYIYI
jgi:hypothetical protein